MKPKQFEGKAPKPEKTDKRWCDNCAREYPESKGKKCPFCGYEHTSEIWTGYDDMEIKEDRMSGTLYLNEQPNVENCATSRRMTMEDKK